MKAGCGFRVLIIWPLGKAQADPRQTRRESILDLLEIKLHLEHYVANSLISVMNDEYIVENYLVHENEIV
jgi:hypothetical protein